MNNAFSNEELNTRDTLTPHIETIWLSISDSLISVWQWMHVTLIVQSTPKIKRSLFVTICLQTEIRSIANQIRKYIKLFGNFFREINQIFTILGWF